MFPGPKPKIANESLRQANQVRYGRQLWNQKIKKDFSTLWQASSAGTLKTPQRPREKKPAKVFTNYVSDSDPKIVGLTYRVREHNKHANQEISQSRN